jgi:predicted GNAT superfamily acetyltransferase
MEILVHPDKLDMEEITPIIRDAWSLSEMGDEPNYILGPMAKELGINQMLIGAYKADEELVGFLLATESKKKNELLLYLLGVKKEYQNGGIGCALLDAFKEEALKKGKEKVSWTFDPFDTHCAHLYFRKVDGICTEYRMEPLHRTEPMCKDDFPGRFFKVEWNLEEKNPYKERNRDYALRHLPKVVVTKEEHEEFLIEISPMFLLRMHLIHRVAFMEFKRLDGLFEHYINERGYTVVDFLYERREKKGFYKLRRSFYC